MYLTESNLVHFLLRRGHVTPASVVDGTFRITPASRRNRNFLVDAPPQCLFLKQVALENPRSLANQDREAGFYRAVDSNPRLSPLAAWMPRFVEFDAPRRTLIIEGCREARHLGEFFQQHVGSRNDAAGALASALSASHGINASDSDDDETGRLFRKQLPGIVRHGLGLELSPAVNDAATMLLERVRGDSRISAGFRELVHGWRCSTLIHGDLRWENCLCDLLPTGESRVRFIDWEEVDVGDAAWDVGGVLNGFLLCDVLAGHGIPFAGLSPLDPSTFNLSSLQPTVATFWRTYIESRGLQPDAATALRNRSVACAGAWIVQSAVERALSTNQREAVLSDMLEIAGHILSDPPRFAEQTLFLR